MQANPFVYCCFLCLIKAVPHSEQLLGPDHNWSSMGRTTKNSTKAIMAAATSAATSDTIPIDEVMEVVPTQVALPELSQPSQLSLPAFPQLDFTSLTAQLPPIADLGGVNVVLNT